MTRALWFLAFTAVLITTAAAQWITIRTQGIPRTEVGEVDRDAPAPLTADGTPDLSGLWWPGGETLLCAPPGSDQPCPELGLGTEPVEEIGLIARALDITFGLQLPYQSWAADLVRQRGERAGLDDPHVQCLPSNIPRLYTLPHLTRTIQTPGMLIMLNEFNAAYRQIYLDGRELPEDPFPSWQGYSVGHWESGVAGEADVLVIETIGLRDDSWLDMKGNPMTEAAHLTERIRRPSFGTLQIEFTVDDSNAYTEPWTVPLEMKFIADTEMIDEVCLEGERDYEHMKDLQ